MTFWSLLHANNQYLYELGLDYHVVSTIFFDLGICLGLIVVSRIISKGGLFEK